MTHALPRPRPRPRTGPRPARRRDRHDQAVSAVIGAILLAGIVLTMLVTVRTQYVPVWQQDDEADHMQTVREQFVGLKSELDRQVGNRTGVTVATPFSLGVEKRSPFSMAPPVTSHGFTFNDDGYGFELFAPRLLVLVNNGTDTAAGLDENWVSTQANPTVSSVSQVQSFRLRIDEVGAGHDTDWTYVRIRDADGVMVGNLTVYQSSDPPDSSVVVKVCRTGATPCRPSDVLYDQGTGFHQSNNVANYIVDLMDPEYRFNKLLAAAKVPLQVEMAQQGWNAMYAITYVPLGGGAVIGQSNPGYQVFENYTAAFEGGVLTLRNQAERFPAQDFVYEGGAFVLRQGDAAVFASPPPFSVARSGNALRVNLGVPSLVGGNASLGQTSTATVVTGVVNSTILEGQAPRLRMNVTSDHPQLWAGFWREAMADAALDEGSHFTITVNGALATLDLYGLIADPANLQYDLALSFQHADIHVTLQE